MKKLSIALLLFLCFSLFGCSFNGGIDLNGDNKDDIKVSTPSLKVYTVYFQTNGGTSIPPKSVTSLDRAPQTYKENHEFRGWYRDESLTVPALYPLDVTDDIILYAKWLRTSDTMKCTDASIKCWNDMSSGYTYTITPPRFDLNTLASEGYIIEITVKYDVYYKKDYDVPWDVGYMGAPKYEIYIYNDSSCVAANENLTTSTSSKTRTITYKTTVSNLKNSKIKLTVSTNNIQNIVYFENIVITYNCYKY